LGLTLKDICDFISDIRKFVTDILNKMHQLHLLKIFLIVTVNL